MKKIISILICGIMVFGLVGCGKSNDVATNTKVETKTEETKTEEPKVVEKTPEEIAKEKADAEEKDSRWNEDGTFKLDSTPNTSEAVDEIVRKAKEDTSKYGYGHYNQIFNIIKGDVIDPWKDRATMERLMYWGTIIENNSEAQKNEKEIGFNACKVAKYVYRGAETKEDAKSVQANLIKLIKQYK